MADLQSQIRAREEAQTAQNRHAAEYRPPSGPLGGGTNAVRPSFNGVAGQAGLDSMIAAGRALMQNPAAADQYERDTRTQYGGGRTYQTPTAEQRASFLQNNPGDEHRITEAFSTANPITDPNSSPAGIAAGAAHLPPAGASAPSGGAALQGIASVADGGGSSGGGMSGGMGGEMQSGSEPVNLGNVGASRPLGQRIMPMDTAALAGLGKRVY